MNAGMCAGVEARIAEARIERGWLRLGRRGHFLAPYSVNRKTQLRLIIPLCKSLFPAAICGMTSHSAVVDGMCSESVAVRDILAHGLRVVFCGLNPGLSSAARGLPFANPTNRFWRVLHLAGFTPSMLTPAESRDLLHYGCGLTTAVRRPTVASSELASSEFADAADALRARIRAYAPAHVAFMGKAAYRI